MTTIALIALVTNFSLGPEIGAALPVGRNADSWRTSFLVGVVARYGLPHIDLDAGFGFSELAMTPDSARWYDYRLCIYSLGASRCFQGFRLGLGGSIYSIDGAALADYLFGTPRSETEYGGYIKIGRDIRWQAGTVDVSARVCIVDSDMDWLGLTCSVLLDLVKSPESL